MTTTQPTHRVHVLGHPLDLVDLEWAARYLAERAHARQATSVVTLNPELVVRAQRDATVHAAIQDATLIVPDGIGVVWAATRAGHTVPGRVPGVELALRLLELGGPDLPTFFLGAKPGVAQRAAEAAHARFGTPIAGQHDGYFPATRDEAIAELVRASGARIVLVGLGERQEPFVAQHLSAFGPVVALSVGGTLDVLAGEARRTPTWTHRWGLEWAWRIAADPSRWHRAPRLAQFVWRVLRAPRRT